MDIVSLQLTANFKSTGDGNHEQQESTTFIDCETQVACVQTCEVSLHELRIIMEYMYT